jgi:thiopeptide-type bacteriocin biosynthesis protein
MIKSYEFYNKFFLRSPLLPLDIKELSEDEFLNWTKQSFFKEAIFLASPALYDRMIDWHSEGITKLKDKEKLLISLYKYYTRIQSRCTPFGLFATCSVGEWANCNKILLKNLKVSRHTRLDMTYLTELSEYLSKHPILQQKLIFYPNNTIYISAKEMRYIDFKSINGARIHSISAVQLNKYLIKILNFAKKGATIAALSDIIMSIDITTEESNQYIKELINNRILLSELNPNITGKEFIHQLMDVLNRIEIDVPNIKYTREVLESTQIKLSKISTNISNEIQKYRQIATELRTLGVPTLESRLFQTDSYSINSFTYLNSEIQAKLLSTVSFLSKLFTYNEPKSLTGFKERFQARYEGTSVPLLEALDTESGLGYLVNQSSDLDPFLGELGNYSNHMSQKQINWDPVQSLLLKKLLHANQDKQFKVSFDEGDLSEINHSTKIFPDSIAASFSVLDENKIHFRHAGGSSAVNMLGRFAHGNDEVHSIINEITEFEQKLSKDKILAEIVHLPEGGVGNVLLRPNIRNYEIPFLSPSLLQEKYQIPLSDLIITLKKNRIVLSSKRLKKEIIPRMSTSHYYSYNALPIYQFLCEIQTQNYDTSGFAFNWGALSDNFKFLPRAEYKDTIIHRATWRFEKKDFQILLESDITEIKEKIKNWRIEWRIPKHILLIEGDNELLIDLENETSLKMFISTIKKKGLIILQEFLFDIKKGVVQNENKKMYTNECMAILLKRKVTESNIEVVPKYTTQVLKRSKTQREFEIGDEWLYYNFYCGNRTADKILVNLIKPLTEYLLKQELINKYFFIRYHDRGDQIRFRMHLTDKKNVGEVLSIVYKKLKDLPEKVRINRIQIETYKRELERYGSNSIELSESLFFIDSKTTLDLLASLEQPDSDIRWKYALISTHYLLDSFKFNSEDRIAFLKKKRDNFKREHGHSKSVSDLLTNKFRSLKMEVDKIIQLKDDFPNEMKFALKLVIAKNVQIKSLTEKVLSLKEKSELEVNFEELISSYIHMMMNRIFPSNQRTFELVMYDLLYNYSRSQSYKGYS